LGVVKTGVLRRTEKFLTATSVVSSAISGIPVKSLSLCVFAILEIPRSCHNFVDEGHYFVSLINEINNKLSKLDLLDSIVQRLSSLETQYDVFRTEMVQIKTEIQNIHMKVDGGENRSQLMEAKMHELERQNNDLHRGHVCGYDCWKRVVVSSWLVGHAGLLADLEDYDGKAVVPYKT
jgi:hypothetical protein